MEIFLNNPIPIPFKRDLEERILLISEEIDSLKCFSEDEIINKIQISLEGNREKDLSLEKLIQKVSEDVALSSKKIEHRTLYENDFPCDHQKDPHELLFLKKNILPTGKGQFVFKGHLLSLFKSLDEKFRSVFLKMGCEEQGYPLLVDSTPLFKINYFQTMSHHLFFPKSLRGDYSVIQDFTKRNKRENNKEEKINFKSGDLGESNSIISPTVCFHCFSALKNSNLNQNSYSYTASNPCSREERSAASGLERLNTFNMREAIFIGGKKDINEKFQECIELAKEVFSTDLKLKFRIQSANDTFFGSEGSKKQIFQSSLNLKFEIQVFLPYANKYISCGSINNHLTTMSDAFGFKISSDASTHSACIGIGLERLALGILAQKESFLSEI